MYYIHIKVSFHVQNTFFSHKKAYSTLKTDNTTDKKSPQTKILNYFTPITYIYS